MLAKVSAILGRHEISISSVIQKESRNGSQVPVVFMTHSAVERNMRAALAELDRLDAVGAPTVRDRVEDFAEAP